jgi:protein-S-isoprenylcysteine O-methyltransferase Ste14
LPACRRCSSPGGPLLPTLLVPYIVSNLWIGQEDSYLERCFGRAYRDYRSGVNELLPFSPKTWSSLGDRRL